MDDVDSGEAAGTGSTEKAMCSESSAPVSTVPSHNVAGAPKRELEEGAAAFGLKKGPCTGRDAGSSGSSTLFPAETAAEEGVADAISGSDGLGGAGARRCSSHTLPRVGGNAGAALYLGLVSSEKVEPGGGEGDVGSIREGEVVDMGAALVFGAVVRAGPETGVT